MKKEIKSINETIEFGIRLGKLLQPSDFVCLNGDLGAGKTTLSKAIGQGLGVEDYITSPTFTLMNSYDGRLPMYHFDVYRLDDWHQLEDIGAEDYFYGDGVCLVEWADKIEEFLPEKRLELYIEEGSLPEERTIHIKAFGDKYNLLIKELVQ
ncbi:MAG: tRNA (adenosine(37)-N6)-threonylcarbamoyltransferase complex ATPase subunit type 1 TsaE [Gudongella sp.]|jgi:tRNA threonylcarbamoyladenosine biosynthesis protein TsaE|nr:tRNA (adenosine(37)-N6)-threonylcarbamoyltransferase complex ATPase subunit type 1 TsaE [Gudongella sp.]